MALYFFNIDIIEILKYIICYLTNFILSSLVFLSVTWTLRSDTLRLRTSWDSHNWRPFKSSPCNSSSSSPPSPSPRPLSAEDLLELADLSSTQSKWSKKFLRSSMSLLEKSLRRPEEICSTWTGEFVSVDHEIRMASRISGQLVSNLWWQVTNYDCSS